MKAIQLSLPFSDPSRSSRIDLYLRDGHFLAFGEDAQQMADVLGMPVDIRQGRKVASFPLVREYSAFPKLVRAGFKLKVIESC